MKLLITGGAGFIGSALIRHVVLSTQDHVVNVDKLTYASNLKALACVSGSDRYAFEQVDICDRAALDYVFTRHQPDAVMHLAAETHVDRSINGPAAFIASNIVGTYTLLEAARHYWQGLDTARKAAFRVHHISTDEVYGDLGDSSQLFSETSRYAPSSPYSASKAGSDHLVWAWHRTYGLPVLMTTCSNNYGPYQYAEKLIPLVILNALQEKPLPLYGSGEQVRDWLYVEDHARALYTAITQGKVGETYNVGAHNQRKNIDVVRQVCSLLDALKPRRAGKYQDLISHVADRPGHDQRYAIDASKIQRELGWLPVESFEAGLRKTVSWYVDEYGRRPN